MCIARGCIWPTCVPNVFQGFLHFTGNFVTYFNIPLLSPAVASISGLTILSLSIAGGALPGTATPEGHGAGQQQPSHRSTVAFVTDSDRRPAPFDAASRDPIGGGRQLLLPLFRGLQARYFV